MRITTSGIFNYYSHICHNSQITLLTIGISIFLHIKTILDYNYIKKKKNNGYCVIKYGN
jgi:hypothetical protein